MGCARYIVDHYGVRSFLADVDRAREFWRDDGGIVGAVLTWAADEGFADFMREFDIDYSSSQEFRQRHILKLLQRKGDF